MGRLNRPARAGYTYRSPGQTNARDVMPNLQEDVVASQNADTDRIRRGLDTSRTRPQNRAQVQNAAARAVTRTGGRAGLTALAGEAGYALGRKIDEEGIPFTDGVGKGVGKKLVDKLGIGSQNNRRDKVELSKSAKERLEDMDTDETMREVDRDIKAAKEYSGKDKPSEYRGDDEFKHGGRVKKMASGGMTASKRADGIATKGKTNCKMY